MRMEGGLVMVGPGKIGGFSPMVMVFRTVAMMSAIMRIERNDVSRMKIVGGMGMRRRRRRHAVLRERNDKDRPQYWSQEPHAPILYGNR
jgi:hypothetical protein